MVFGLLAIGGTEIELLEFMCWKVKEDHQDKRRCVTSVM